MNRSNIKYDGNLLAIFNQNDEYSKSIGILFTINYLSQTKSTE